MGEKKKIMARPKSSLEVINSHNEENVNIPTVCGIMMKSSSSRIFTS